VVAAGRSDQLAGKWFSQAATRGAGVKSVGNLKPRAPRK
jgi:hypothetical protein